MLIICNGAPNSGSTWVSQIVSKIPGVSPIPDEYRREGWSNPSLKEDLVSHPDHVPNLSSGTFYCKTHIVGDKFVEGFLNLPNVKFVNIIRDYRDTFVSRFFHDLLKKNVTFGTSMEDYFSSGRAESMVRFSVRYQRNWHLRSPEKKHPFLFSYEMLHNDWKTSMKEFSNFLGEDFVFSEEICEKLRASTSIADKDKGEGKFFRKATTGDYKNHLSDEQEKRIIEILHEEDYVLVKRFMRDQYPYLEKYLKDSDVGL